MQESRPVFFGILEIVLNDFQAVKFGQNFASHSRDVFGQFLFTQLPGDKCVIDKFSLSGCLREPRIFTRERVFALRKNLGVAHYFRYVF